MNTDELLTEFRANVPVPDEATARHIYERAMCARRQLPRRRLALVVAGVAICAAAAAVVVTVAFTGGTTDRARSTTSPHLGQALGGLDVSYVHSGGALSSIAITLSTNVTNASVQLQVVHTSATSAEAYAGKAQTQVVFQEDVPTTTPPASSNVSAWSGTLSPSQWSGGCESGLYRIQYLAIPPGRTFANATEQPGSEFGAGEWFSCTGS